MATAIDVPFMPCSSYTRMKDYTSPTTNSDSSGLTVSNDEKAPLAVSIELLLFAYFVFLDESLDLQEAVRGIFEAFSG